jgi:hypothetical protein
MFFVPMMQRYASDKSPITEDASLYAGAMVIETERPMSEMEQVARKTLAAINPNLTVVKFQTFDDQIADRFAEERMVARLTQLFGALALRRDGVRGGAADAGDWDSHGAGRAARYGGRHDSARGGDPGGDRAGDRGSGGDAFGAVRKDAAV